MEQLADKIEEARRAVMAIKYYGGERRLPNIDRVNLAINTIEEAARMVTMMDGYIQSKKSESLPLNQAVQDFLDSGGVIKTVSPSVNAGFDGRGFAQSDVIQWQKRLDGATE